MSNINRLKQLAGIRENIDVLSDEEADEMRDREYEIRAALEKRMIKVIVDTFSRVGIAIRESDYSSGFDVDFNTETGESYARADDCTAAQVAALVSSGLAQDYKISSSDHAVMFEFTVDSRVVDSFRN